MQNPNGRDVRVHVATINTASAVELTIRSMRLHAGYPFELVVGDGGSTDGSLPRLRDLVRRGWLTLEVAPEGRTHAEWLDRWFASCSCRYAVFADSDVEFMGDGWLRDMVAAAVDNKAALVATRIQARGGVAYRHPVTGAERVLAPRPEPWLMLLDVPRLRGVMRSGFGYRDEPAPGAPGGKMAFDVGAAMFRDLSEAGLPWVEMPPEFGARYHHFGGLSWQKGADRRIPAARRAKQALKAARIRWRLARARSATRSLVPELPDPSPGGGATREESE